MEKKQLLLITTNSDLATDIDFDGGPFYEITTVKNIHAGYSLALSYLPDVILVDYTSLGLQCLQNLESFKSTHFLNKSFLFILGQPEDKQFLNGRFKNYVDGVLKYQNSSSCSSTLIDQIEDTIRMKRCLTNYWKDSFMGLFNLLGNPVVLLQDEKIIAMNDAFKKDFFITKARQVQISDFVKEENKHKVKETLRKFVRGKHMKSVTTTSFLMNGKSREAKITFSKLDKNLRGQLVMMIHFTGKEMLMSENIGSVAEEAQQYLDKGTQQETSKFTKREKEVISLLCKGYKTKEISEALCISTKTIEKHRSNIIRRTQSGTIVESIVFALNNNMIEI